MAMIISSKVRAKLANKKPPITQEEIEQCFANRVGKFILDTREEHASDPPTRWFVAETNFGRKLKIAFIPKEGDIIIRTAVDANADEQFVYLKRGSY